MSGHQEYQCNKCGCQWEAIEATHCPQCSSFAAPTGSVSDSERLDWLMRNISGQELRRLGITTSAGMTRQLLDEAINRTPNVAGAEISIVAPAGSSPFPDIGCDPLKLDGKERIEYNAHQVRLNRLRTACSIQQKGVPNQTALVWRVDISWLLGQFVWREAGHKAAIERETKAKNARTKTPPI